MARIIIGIHGLGNKPPQHILKNWWMQSIREGLGHIGHSEVFLPFELVYWADLFHPRPLDVNEKDPDSPYYLEFPYTPAVDFDTQEIGKIRQQVMDFLDKEMGKFFSDNEFSNTLNLVSDWIIRRYFADLDLYYRSMIKTAKQTEAAAREVIRQRLTAVLKKHQGKEILLIAHSMGSIIAYEVLTLFASESQIDTLVTIGSPLGQPIIFKKFREELAQDEFNGSKPKVPENIRTHWFNLADLRDHVAMNYQLADDFTENSRHLEITDKIVSNNYRYQNKANPHKIYGYLRTPELSRIIYEFLSRDRSKFGFWLSNRLQQIKQRYFTAEKRILGNP
jgi:pimeloyl-ACP methyl ester carboxylesterase